MILFPLCQLPHTSQDWAVVAGVNSYHLARSDCVHCPPILCSVTSLLQLEIVDSLKSAVEGSIYTTEIGRCYKAGLVCSNCWLLTAATAAAKLLQSCPTLCDPIDGSPPGFPEVPGILQARTLEWGAISFSNAGKWKVKVKWLSRVRLFETPWLQPIRLLCPWDFPGKSTGVGCHRLLRAQGLSTIIFITDI